MESKDYISDQVNLLRQGGLDDKAIIEFLVDRYNGAMGIVHSLMQSMLKCNLAPKDL